MINHSNKDLLLFSVLFLLGSTCFLIYLLYRSEDIILNKTLYSVLPSLRDIKFNVHSKIPLNNFIIYNLPAGLWVLSLSLLFQNVKVKIFEQRFRLRSLPLEIGIIIELMQLSRITDGTFDNLDIITMIGGFLIATIIIKIKWFNIQARRITYILSMTGILILFFGNL